MIETANRTRVAFLVYDYTQSFEEISQRLSLQPTNMPEGVKNSSRVQRWELNSGLPESEELESHLQALLSILTPSTKAINTLAKECRCVISVGLNYHQYNPEIVLEPEVLIHLAALGVKLWLDIYCDWDGETDNHLHRNDSGKL